jgi:hypothetical protein
MASRDDWVCDRLRDIMSELTGEPVERFRLHALRYAFRTNIVAEGITDTSTAEAIIHPTKQER